VPTGHEEIFARGLAAGFQADFLVASHLLVPQVENSLRFVLEANGVNVANLLSDMTQPVKLLGQLLGMGETSDIFGEDAVFELRGCLIEKHGFDLRNRVAHGFVTAHECNNGSGPVLAWWLILRLCVAGFLTSAANDDA
jgi:hypothetical protein